MQVKSMQDDEPRCRFARIEGRAGELYAWASLAPALGGEWLDGPLSEDPAYEREGKLLDEFPIDVILTYEDDRWTFRS
jgi:hypothetical protein